MLPLALLGVKEGVRMVLIQQCCMGRLSLVLYQQGWKQPGWIGAFWVDIPLV